MPKNARILGIRLDDHTNQRLTRFEKETLIEGVSLARAALIASLDTYEAMGTLTLPLKITSGSQTSSPQKIIPLPSAPSVKPLDKAAEDPRPYKTGTED